MAKSDQIVPLLGPVEGICQSINRTVFYIIPGVCLCIKESKRVQYEVYLLNKTIIKSSRTGLQIHCSVSAPRSCNGGGNVISRMFNQVPVAIIAHTFSHFKFFWGGNSNYLKNSSLKYSPLLRELINHNGGVKNEPTKD
jgi:hypothetical protein